MARTVGECFRSAVEAFRNAGMESPEAEARLLLSEVFSLSPAELPVSEQIAASGEMELVRSFVGRRLAHEPAQYILKKAYFHDIELEVSPAVLIPRPETEILAEWAIRVLPRNGRMLDVGTGSGALALAAAHARPDILAVALDVSQAALDVAERNLRKLELTNVEFRESSLCSALVPHERFDVAVANLPYVPEGERPFLAPEVTEHEPGIALFVPGDGTRLMRRALREIVPHLSRDGALGFELDPRQAEPMGREFAAAGLEVAILRDLAGKERFVTGRAKK